ncbi:MAG: hypothetical protein ACI9JN_002669 [Bacteroidia bacterium]|jgi:hypothetical protein
MKKVILYFSLVLSMAFLASCGGDDTATPSTGGPTGKLSAAQKEMLYDKVWFSTSTAGGIEHEFLSDGTLRLSRGLDGRWTWLNGGDTMSCSDHTNARFQYVFQTITASTMSFKYSIDNYKSTFSYKDTE